MTGPKIPIVYYWNNAFASMTIPSTVRSTALDSLWRPLNLEKTKRSKKKNKLFGDVVL